MWKAVAAGVARGAKAGVKAHREGGDARDVTKASVKGAGVPNVGGVVDKAVDFAFDKAPEVKGRAEHLAQGLRDKFTTPKPIGPTASDGW